jgi:Spy/CpxP family protein refolding chaperone
MKAMKQTMMTMLLVLVAMTTAAQDKDHKKLRENFFNHKVEELAQTLNMSEEQKEKFVPIYRRYNDEMRAAIGPRKLGERKPPKDCVKKPRKECDNKKPALSEEEQLERTKRKMENQQKAQAIRLKYVDEFATVLTAQQVNQLFEVEKDIAKRIVKRNSHYKGPHNCLPEKGRQRPCSDEKQQK